VLTASSADELKNFVGVAAEVYAVFYISLNSIICDCCMLKETGSLVVELYM